RGLLIAVVASGVVGLVVDSVVFLWLAFGSLEFLLGQIVGKAWMVLLSISFVAWLRRSDARLRIAPGLGGRPGGLSQRCAKEVCQGGVRGVRPFTTRCARSRLRPSPPCC